MKKIIFLSLLLICQLTVAQDSVFKNIPKEPKIFNKIDTYSKKRKFTQFFHRLLFRDYNPNQKPEPEKKVTIKQTFDNKIIRNIEIETLDPFGYSIENENEKPHHFLEKFGNKVHVTTRDFTIRNYLLFKKHELLDTLKINESARIIRTQRFARSVVIIPKSIKNCKDSIDVYIRVLDNWSIIPTGAFSKTQFNINVEENNFLGLGHQFNNGISRRFLDNSNGYSTRYEINNFKNSFANFAIASSSDLNDNTSKSISINRPFYSVFAHFAGGALYQYGSYNDYLPDSNGALAFQNLKLKTYDFWLGRSFELKSKNEINNRQTNGFLTASYRNINYLNKPSADFDSKGFYGSEQLLLSTFGVATQKFKQDRYLFNFGVVEDVPFGILYSITSGVQYKNDTKRAYFGGRFSFANYYKLGYFSTNFEIGSFFTNGINQESTLRFDINYFSPLLRLGSSKFRQFINPTLTLGWNRNPIIRDRLNLADYKGIPGLTTSTTGTKKASITLQSQLYIPRYWYGFNFSPFINFSFGVLGDTSNATFNPKILSSYSIGTVISNNYLIFNSFQISFSYIPYIQNEGNNIFKTNSFQNSNLPFTNFQIGEPGVVSFR